MRHSFVQNLSLRQCHQSVISSTLVSTRSRSSESDSNSDVSKTSDADSNCDQKIDWKQVFHAATIQGMVPWEWKWKAFPGFADALATDPWWQCGARQSAKECPKDSLFSLTRLISMYCTIRQECGVIQDLEGESSLGCSEYVDCVKFQCPPSLVSLDCWVIWCWLKSKILESEALVHIVCPYCWCIYFAERT